MMKIGVSTLTVLCALAVLFDPSGLQASVIGEHMQQMEKTKAQKMKELSRLEALENIVANEIGTAKAEMAQNMSNNVQQVGKSKVSPEGLVMTSNGVVHTPKQDWELNVDKLRQEYKNAGIYTQDEIDTIVEFHKAYVKNRGFTAGIAEQLARVAEAKAQQRTIQKYIALKKQEIEQLENALQGSSPDASSAASEGGGGGGY